MKNSIVISMFFFALICLSCSSETSDIIPTDSTPNISSYRYAAIGITTPEPSSYTDYILSDNKIVSSTYFAMAFTDGLDDEMTNDIYSYDNNRVSEITTFNNGTVERTIKFSYNNDGNLTEYLNTFYNLNTQQTYYDRHIFEYAQDTVYAERRRSTDGINYDSPVSDIKMVLDGNDNRIYFQTYDYINIDDFITIKELTFDINNNVIAQESSAKYPDGSTFFTNSQTYSYNLDQINTLHAIHSKTFGKRTLMLLYHLQLDILNDFKPKILSPNSMNALEVIVPNPNNGIIPEVSNAVNDEGYTIFDEYTVYLSDGISLASKYRIEYTFE